MEYQKQKDPFVLEKLNLKENKKQGTKFKDKCDICNTYDYCKGYNDLVLCESCITKELSIKPFVAEGQMSIFDYIGGNKDE